MFGYLGNFIRKWVIFCRPNKNQQILPHTHFFQQLSPCTQSIKITVGLFFELN